MTRKKRSRRYFYVVASRQTDQVFGLNSSSDAYVQAKDIGQAVEKYRQANPGHQVTSVSEANETFL